MKLKKKKKRTCQQHGKCNKILKYALIFSYIVIFGLLSTSTKILLKVCDILFTSIEIWFYSKTSGEHVLECAFKK